MNFRICSTIFLLFSILDWLCSISSQWHDISVCVLPVARIMRRRNRSNPLVLINARQRQKRRMFPSAREKSQTKKTVMPTISMCINRGKPGYWITLCFYPPRCPLVLILIQHSMWNYFSICCLLSTHRTSQHPLHQPWHDRPAQCWARISAGLLGELCAGPHTDLEVEGQRGGDTWIGL